MKELFVGLMSGTSIDGIDAVLVDFESLPGTIIAKHSLSYDDDTTRLLHSLCSPSDNEIEKAGRAKVLIARYEALAVNELLEKAGVGASDVTAIGSHGQTVRHRPDEHFSIQLDNGALLSALTKIDTVCDFRSADLAHEGNGAPLAQSFHRILFGRDDTVSMVLNLGGISNLTIIDKDKNHTIAEAFDTGPANTLIDAACRMLLHQDYDKDGLIARQGKVNRALLAKYLESPYLKRQPPKSTGREDFSLDFIKDELFLATQDREFIPDFIATLTEFTIIANVNAIRECMFRHHIDGARLILCGGGAYNPVIEEGLTRRLKANGVEVFKAEDLGVDSKLIEAHTFAYFAYMFMHRQCVELGTSTGAARPSVLGCLYPCVR